MTAMSRLAVSDRTIWRADHHAAIDVKKSFILKLKKRFKNITHKNVTKIYLKNCKR